MAHLPTLLGLGSGSSNDEICRAVFEFVDKRLHYLVFSTLETDGARPAARGLDVNLLSDGRLYFGIARGKPVYEELAARPYTVGTGVYLTEDHLSIACRISGEVAPAQDPDRVAEYWALNPGTRSMYRKHPEVFSIFYLRAGEGELFHVCDPDHCARLRFGFGGAAPRPPRYVIDPGRCVGCGLCAENCLTDVIHPAGECFFIDHTGCLECGVCRELCPNGAVLQNGYR